mmetsp:Transcript_4961/g.8601  ORF Transcript_4961/g.8601 Transcript_4961/m.8601 type:complete len:174 (-) Transcript_4961:98-619(-)|eukprot:CAMPEP_0198197354 /NCGR_PEP_ID=MMETSP1445-20131203/975_1 /TAXON_ID=36898 /ORGANISM="Pyramimonas sp., Strain CCMP2087" /LENGTH=173 /DNA_ID=CAMNT_0043866623 /DNA_START=70 /DNA_END=591 /DNA_ORIENTATION=+
MSVARATSNVVFCQAVSTNSTQASRTPITRPLKARRGMKIVSMAGPREDVIEWETQGHLKEEIANFDYGHTDGHHTWKHEYASGFVAGDGHAKFKQHIADSLKDAGGPGSLQNSIILGAVPVSIGVLVFGGGTPETSGVGLMLIAAAVSMLVTATNQLKEMAELKEETGAVKA